ncbi:FecR domain-containing protein [Novosphingobium colocasiae]|uniref:FecR family protein n=1 Tax=Novosphingobium colocasiae TaxID=1256513 RepID=UPI0035ADED94
MPHDDLIETQALDWAVRAGDPEFADWEAFTRWLDESPRHAAAYDRASAAVADAAELIAAHAPVPAANDDPGPMVLPLYRRRWFAGALAASLALVAGIGLWRGQTDRYIIAADPGTMRTAALADGGSVALSGGTRLELDHRDPRYARLLAGQALFTVRHDATHPFEVRVGDDRLVDAGTVFDVTLNGTGMRVAVSEGLVVFNPDQQQVSIEPGHALSREAGSDVYALSEIAPAQVGEWRSGRLTFEAATPAQVAADLTRLTGIAYAAAPGAQRRVSGSIVIDPLRRDPAALGPLLGLTVRSEDGRWMIEAD